MIEIKTEDGVAPAFEFGSGPSVLFLIDGIGMRPAMHEMAERLGKAGYHVLMPDLFYRIGAYTAPEPAKLFSDPAVRNEWFSRVMSTTTPEKLLRDIPAYLARLPGKVGVTGYCMGGRIALSVAGNFPDRIVAAAAYHPGGLVTDTPDSPHLLAPKIVASVYIGRAKEDANFTDAQLAVIEKALSDAHVDHVIETYPALHGWVPSDTPVHDAAQAERHWETLLALFGKHLH
jgi:carboxymethylenebutenolidase